jgi:hypothetical protein
MRGSQGRRVGGGVHCCCKLVFPVSRAMIAMMRFLPSLFSCFGDDVLFTWEPSSRHACY